MTKIETQTRAQIAEFLPGALSRALTSYFEFSKSKPDEKECKDFSNHHSAAKAAISHVELLLKLAKWADLPDQTAEDERQASQLQILLASAQKELDIKN